ncbi:MAG: hypothetical protein HFJ27_04860 [Clostridia bacterium]|nr:hypothetical protein [Clostridia bacterium]
MRKILIIVLIAILLVLGYFMLFNGLNILGIDILSIVNIKDESELLDVELQKVSTLTSVDRPKAMSELNESMKQLTIAKEEYNDKILYHSSDEIAQATQGIRYEMEYLWTKIGNHATKNGIVLKFTVSQSASGVANQYDLSFVATGRYVSISEFIASLENDASLNFKIENAKVAPFEGSTENLQATFDVKEIYIVKVNSVRNSNSSIKPNTTDNNTSENNSNTLTNDTQNTISQEGGNS